MHVVDESTCFRLFGYAIHKEIDAAQCDDDKKKVNILKRTCAASYNEKHPSWSPTTFGLWWIDIRQPPVAPLCQSCS